MHGSTSPEKKAWPACSHLLLSQTRAMARRASSLAGSTPMYHSKYNVFIVEVHSGKQVPPPHWPSDPWRASRRAPHPFLAIFDRSAATTSPGSSVRSRITCQRIEGSESNNHSTTVMSVPLAICESINSNSASSVKFFLLDLVDVRGHFILAFDGTSVLTIAPGPIHASAPIFTPGKMETLIPVFTPSLKIAPSFRCPLSTICLFTLDSTWESLNFRLAVIVPAPSDTPCPRTLSPT